jgi:hypothetical protein
MTANTTLLRSYPLAGSALNRVRLDLPFEQLYKGIMERVFRVLDAGADEAPCICIQRLDLGMVQVDLLICSPTYTSWEVGFDSRRGREARYCGPRAARLIWSTGRGVSRAGRDAELLRGLALYVLST